jgi:ATP-dependent RNA helicase DeaD
MLAESRSNLDEKIIRLLHQAGYLKPTPLQEKVVPVILKGKDVAVEAGEHTGKTASFVLSVLCRLEKTPAGIKTLVIASSVEHAKKINREFRKFVKPRLFSFSVILLGEEDTRRDEYRSISRGPDIVIGTSKKIIDHIRRGNFNFEHLRYLVVDVPDEGSLAGFDLDIQFITNKLPEKRQTILFSPVELSSVDGLLAILKRPVMIPQHDWKAEQQKVRCRFYLTDGLDEKEKFSALRDIVVAKGIDSLFVFCHKKETAGRLVEYLKKNGFKPEYYGNEKDEAEKLKILKDFNNRKISAIVTPLLAIGNDKYIAPAYTLHYDIPENMAAYTAFFAGNANNALEVISLIETGTLEKLKTSEETKKMDLKTDNLPTDEEIIQGFARKILKNIKDETDTDSLNRIKKILNKNVPFLHRSNFMSYLFKELYVKKIGKPSSRSSSPAVQAAPAGSSQSTMLFLSIGKNRKVFPQDLVTLFTGALGIKRSDIKEIKILDNYSFVGLTPETASLAIEKLDGSEFKGKKITVNFARKKEPRERR